PLRRPALIRWADGRETSYGYDLHGRLALAKNSWAAVGFAYDPDGRMTVEEQPEGDVSYARDPAGRLLEVRLRGRLIARYAYDLRGRVLQATDSTGTAYRFDYPRHGTAVSIGGPNEIEQQLSYGPMRRLARHSVTARSGNLLLDREYSYD